MRIESIGIIEYKSKEKEWFGLVEGIAPGIRVELTISAQKINNDIGDSIESVKQLALDYDSIMIDLYGLAFRKYQNTEWEKTLDEIKKMYFLSAVSLMEDSRTWWLVLEPDYKVESIYNHFLRFTMVDRTVVWANFEIESI